MHLIPEHRATLSAAVIAGGKSTRFGSSKIEAVINGKRLIDHAAALASDIADRVLIIANDPLTGLPEHFRMYPDRIPDCGPIGGLYTALYYADTPWIAVLPCDAPFLPVAVYNHLLFNLDENSPVVASSHAGLEPMVSIWHRSNIAIVDEQIARQQYSLIPLLERLNARRIDLPDSVPDYQDDWFFNVNYKRDVERNSILIT